MSIKFFKKKLLPPNWIVNMPGKQYNTSLGLKGRTN